MQKPLILIFIIFIISSCLVFAVVNNVQAYDFGKESGLDNTAGEKGTGHTKLMGDKEIPEIIGLAIKIILIFLGVIFFLFMIHGGYIWMTAAGNEEQVGKAKKLITNALIGLIIVLAAYAITYYVTSEFFKAQAPAPAPEPSA